MIEPARIDNMIDQIEKKLISYLEGQGYYKYLVDPVEHRVISTHYGQTHCCAGFIIKGLRDKNCYLYNLGLNLLGAILSTWDSDKKQADFHNDFNNFALCLIWEEIHEIEYEYSNWIKEIVLSTHDSVHDTINWLPMRMLVSSYRFKWTNDKVHMERYEFFRQKIEDATYKDGFIEDRLPKGTSFNLQYNVATVALLSLAYDISGDKTEIVKEIDALLYAALDDGDINYLGRGCNQIFAWGPWIYLLAGTEEQSVSQNALEYIESRLPSMLENNNLILNCEKGVERAWWWDYHYSSVYIAHLYLWLVLAGRPRHRITPVSQPQIHDSGLKLIRKDGWTVVLFNGRNEYLAEAGPLIEAIWNKNYGTIYKGCFGAYGGSFGLKYSNYQIALMNYLGIQQIDVKAGGLFQRLMEKIGFNRSLQQYIKVVPIFANHNIEITEDYLTIRYQLKVSRNSRVALPIAIESSFLRIKFSFDSENTWNEAISAISYNNQYGLRKLLYSGVKNTKVWTVKIYVK